MLGLLLEGKLGRNSFALFAAISQVSACHLPMHTALVGFALGATEQLQAKNIVSKVLNIVCWCRNSAYKTDHGHLHAGLISMQPPTTGASTNNKRHSSNLLHTIFL